MYRVHLSMNDGRTIVVIGTNCTGSWKSNYHTITTTTAPVHDKKRQIHTSLIILSFLQQRKHLILKHNGMKHYETRWSHLNCLFVLKAARIDFFLNALIGNQQYKDFIWIWISGTIWRDCRSTLMCLLKVYWTEQLQLKLHCFYMMFGSSLSPVVYRRAHVLFTLFVFTCAEWCPTHIVLCWCFSSPWVPYVAKFSGLSIFDWM